MAKLVWDQTTEKLYELGIKNCVLYPMDNTGAYPEGVAWNGVTGIDENPTGGEATKIYADDIVYATLTSAESFGFTLKAYTYPTEFEACDGSAAPVDGVALGQQERKTFGLVYKTSIGNDVDGNDHGYKIHVVYGCKAAPSARSFATINESPSAIEFSWSVTTTPAAVTGYAPTATIVIDSTKFTETAKKAKLEALEDKLFGTASAPAELPDPDTLLGLLK